MHHVLDNAFNKAHEEDKAQKFEYLLTTKAGHIWFEANMSPIKDDENEFDRAIVVVRDITNRKHAELSMQKNEEKLSSFWNQQLMLFIFLMKIYIL